MSANIVEFSHVRKSWGKSTALNDVSLEVRKGEILTLLGPSGCGKSTLMRIAAGFETATAGKVFIDGKDMTGVPPEKRPVNMVFQRYALFPHLDVFDNVAFGLRLKGHAKARIAAPMMVGASIGMVTSRNVWSEDAPRSRAASSSATSK